MIDKRIKYICQLTIVVCIHASCDRPAESVPKPTLAELRENAYRKAGEKFVRAAFCKPKDGSAPPDIFALSPLIVGERLPDSGQNAPVFDDPLELSQRNITPKVFYEQSSVNLRGKPHTQLLFIWFRAGEERQSNSAPAWAVRLTLDADRFPMIAETFEHGGPLLKIFVSKSLEEAARKQYKTPLPNRSYVVESSVDSQPGVIVPRIFEDGPQPMGPYVYEDKRLSISTVLCRCSPSQVDDFTENMYYELKPAKLLDKNPMLPDSSSSIQGAYPQTDDPAWLERALRLPDVLP